MHQLPEPGANIIVHAGDSISFSLSIDTPSRGAAWLRTNLQGASIRRTEIIDQAEAGKPRLDSDWFDIPMHQAGDTEYVVTVPVFEQGIFQAKALFLPENTSEPIWPEGSNVNIKVEPAARVAGNSIYSAFVRLFGPPADPAKDGSVPAEDIRKLDDDGYTVIPKSGKFRDLIRQLDHITEDLGFRNLLLLPIHPTPTTYARMGRFGSPFAALDLMDVDPALAEFDRRTTPLDQFRELIDAVHARQAYLFMDMPLNHTGWASALQIHHPSWFLRDKKRQFQSPGAWGVTWEDLAELDYEDKGLWRYMADVFLYWCMQGVDGFRCDAGYMVPTEVWQYITAKVRRQFPDTVFLLEGLGGKKETMRKLLTTSNLNWAYSELFQSYDRAEIENSLPEIEHISKTQGLLVHFAETHDNNRLAASSKQYASMRTALSALLSERGAFGITCGVEWFASEKIVVHERTSLNWGAEENQIDHISKLNSLIKEHPAFSPESTIKTVPSGKSNAIAALRTCPVSGASALILANLDMDRPAELQWDTASLHAGADCFDLISGQNITVASSSGISSLQLDPGRIMCLSAVKDDNTETGRRSDPTFQSAKAVALEMVQFRKDIEWTEDKPTELADELCTDAEAFHSQHVSGDGTHALVLWRWPEDTRRTVPVPGKAHILVRAPCRFRADLLRDGATLERRDSLKDSKGWFAILTRAGQLPGPAQLEISGFDKKNVQRYRANLMTLETVSNSTPVVMTRTAAAVRALDSTALCTNGRGAISLIRGAWGEIKSQYDALLAGNLHPSSPCDRQVMLTRCRAWLVLRGFSQEINIDCLNSFTSSPPDCAEWLFYVPSGMGQRVCLRAALQLTKDKNAVSLHFNRDIETDTADLLDPAVPVRLILRFDIEDRSFHTKTKAFAGPESSWPGVTETAESGFVFTPAHDRKLSVTSDRGNFTSEHEWLYMVKHPADAERGLDGVSDLFSPGYFSVDLKGGESVSINAAIKEDQPHDSLKPERIRAQTTPLSKVLKTAMSQFIVARDSSKTVIAGYPWFLDWGRDTLICLRGMIACGMIEESREILCQFASFEEKGTIPNMIRGDDVSNRDTSDAPLWMHVAAKDLIDATDMSILETPCSGRSLGEVLVSIAENYLSGTPNGIYTDQQTGLVFSPSHFTWMDTNHPAGTPREGYPIEIQALWFKCLELTESITGDNKWKDLADKVRNSITQLYYSESRGYLSDCLHCAPGTSALDGTADDHLRPNQLLAITLGAVNDSNVCESILQACRELLVPGAIRSLADREVSYALPVTDNGSLLNDPHRPYWGTYSGDEDTRRKPAYHNGTAWTWPMPSYCEALTMTFGSVMSATARSYLSGMLHLLQANCTGQIPELTDGDTPHREKGCTAQAWGVSEFARVLALLENIT